MIYCQGPKCHEYKTKDRIRGHKGDKHYETRRNRHFYNGEFCSNMCRDDWFNTFGKRAVDHFGRIHEPKRTMAIARGISIEIGEVITTIHFTSLMIYLANVDQLLNNNTMIKN